MIETAQFNRVLTMELHTSAIQGFFNIPVDHLYAKPIFSAYFTNLTNPVVVSPDAGGVERARAMAKHFNCGLAIVDKRRDKPNESTVMHIIGDVEGKNCIIIDDIVDTAGSITQASEALLRQGANTVTAAISHPVLSGPALDRINRSNLKELLVTDSILLSKEARECSKIKQLGIAELFGKAIRRIHNDDSISALFI
jgi:ribose-phosphate pyrophosphokinase